MKKRKKGFTLSEVVITLVVIGIVAAITVPMMSSNAHDKKWNVARQKAHATIGEAFRLMTVNGEIDKTLSTQQFVEKVIPKYLKLAKTCSTASACGFASSYKKAVGSGSNSLPTTWQTSTEPAVITVLPPKDGVSEGTFASYNHSNPNTNSSYFFQTLDGFSVNFFYNPYCIINDKEKFHKYFPETNVYVPLVMDAICFMGVYDMNGKKGPNQVGKDMGFVGSFYNGFNTSAASVLPRNSENLLNSVPHTGYKWVQGAISYCENLDKERTWILPTSDEMSLLYLNMKLVWGWNNVPGRYYFTRTNYGKRGSSTTTDFGHISFVRERKGGIASTNYENLKITPPNSSYFICVRANALK